MNYRERLAATRRRNVEITDRYLAGGVFLRELGAEHGISRERVRQIIVRERMQRAGINVGDPSISRAEFKRLKDKVLYGQEESR